MGKQWKQWHILFWGAPKSLQVVTAAMKLKEEKQKAKEKRNDIPIWMQFQRIAREDKKAFLSDQYKQ